LVSLLTVVLLLGLGWYYFRLVGGSGQIAYPPSSVPKDSDLKIDPRPAPAPPKAHEIDGVDFSFPPRFTEGVPKAKGENYSFVIVLGKTEKEDLNWLHNELPEVRLVVYEVDKADAVNRVPRNKGREAMVSFSTLTLQFRVKVER
jgi:hypothetical protein